jgi:hypothetical protein
MAQEIRGYDLTTKARVFEFDDSTHSPIVNIGGSTGIGADAFGRMKVSSPTSIFSSSFEYDLQPLIYEVTTVTGGSVVHGNSDTPTNKTCAVLKTDGQSAASATMTQIGVNHYQPGKSQLVLTTFVLGVPVANVRKRIGYFDANDGLFLEQTTVARIVIRTSVDGSTGDTATPQTSWNIDKMNGLGGATNPSGILLDWSKQQIFFIQFQWLGAGRIVFGFDIDGQLIPVHAINNANQDSNSQPYMRTANLPIRAEITSTAASDATNFRFICAGVDSEGGQVEETGYDFSVSNGITPIGVTTRRAILSIRPATTFNSIANTIRMRLSELELSCSTNDGYWELVYGGALGGSPSWGAVNDSSGIEFDIAGTTVTGGIAVHRGIIVAGAGSSRNTISQDVDVKYPLAISAAGVQKSYSLVVTSFTGTCNATGAICWREIR